MNPSPFHTAAGLNYAEALQLMLDLGDEAYKDSIFRYQDIISSHARCPLHESAENGAVERSRVLLRHRLSDQLLAVRDRNGANPFHIAMTQGGVGVTKAFLDIKGTSLLSEKIGVDGGMHLAAGRGEPDVVDLLLDYAPESFYVDEEKSILHSAAGSGSAETVKVVLNRTGDSLLEYSDRYGKSPLHDATIRGHTEVINLLLSKHADPNVTDHGGRTCLHYAALRNFDKLIKLSVKAGSNIEARDREGNTPLAQAIKERAVSSIHMLLNLGANMPILDENLRAWATAQPWWNARDRLKSGVGEYYPETPEDVWTVAFDLQRALGLPKELVRMILQEAEYWPRSDVQRTEQCLVNNYHGDLVYLQSQPISGKVQIIIFTITSHNQGWSDHVQDHGTYNGSWTWFSAWKIRGSDKTQGPEILRNVHARRDPKTHVVCWPRREGFHWHPGDGPDSEQIQREWLHKLQEGDRVLIVAKAKYPGWTNFAIRAEMSVFASVI